MNTAKIPYEIWRGGTSRALVLDEDDLPSAGHDRDELLATLVGNRSPLQVDGLGGNHALTSKIAILRRDPEEADVAFTFAQASVSGGSINYDANCGNISAAVIPWALAQGWISEERARDGADVVTTSNHTTYRSRMRSGSSGGLGSSVRAGSEVSVLTEFLNPGGAQTGALFPTGASHDTVFVGGQPLEVTVVDAGNLCMIATADSWERATGVSVWGLQKGDTKPFEEVRISIATQTGIALDGAVPPNTPKLLIIGPGADTPPWPVGEDDLADMWGMTLSMGAPHTAFPVTGGIGVSAAAALEDTVVSRLLGRVSDHVRIRHPSGVLALGSRLDQSGSRLEAVGVERGVRRIARGIAFTPD